MQARILLSALAFFGVAVLVSLALAAAAPLLQARVLGGTAAALAAVGGLVVLWGLRELEPMAYASFRARALRLAPGAERSDARGPGRGQSRLSAPTALQP